MHLLQGRKLANRHTRRATGRRDKSEDGQKVLAWDGDAIGKRILVPDRLFGKTMLGADIPWK